MNEAKQAQLKELLTEFLAEEVHQPQFNTLRDEDHNDRNWFLEGDWVFCLKQAGSRRAGPLNYVPVMTNRLVVRVFPGDVKVVDVNTYRFASLLANLLNLALPPETLSQFLPSSEVHLDK